MLDDSYFAIDEPEPGAFDGQPYRTYNVVPNALADELQGRAVPVHGRTRRMAASTSRPIPCSRTSKIDNNLALVDGPCRGYQAGISFNHAEPESLERVVLDGQFSRRCNVYGLGRTVLQHDTFAFGLFSSLWKEVGGSFAGKLRKAQHSAGATTSRRSSWRSKPLGEIVRSINKNSNNVMTRQLLYTLGAEAAGAPGTRENGVEAVRELLAARGLNIDSLMLQNGAGLSRDERASMQFLVDLLRAAYRSPYAPEFIASLSLGGLDGTTRGRFDAAPAAGVMHLKTGRLDHVSAVAGYVRARERADLCRRRRHEQPERASRARAGARGSRAAVHALAALAQSTRSSSTAGRSATPGQTRHLSPWAENGCLGLAARDASCQRPWR